VTLMDGWMVHNLEVLSGLATVRLEFGAEVCMGRAVVDRQMLGGGWTRRGSGRAREQALAANSRGSGRCGRVTGVSSLVAYSVD
jgi:hypothetical protein